MATTLTVSAFGDTEFGSVLQRQVPHCGIAELPISLFEVTIRAHSQRRQSTLLPRPFALNAFHEKRRDMRIWPLNDPLNMRSRVVRANSLRCLPPVCSWLSNTRLFKTSPRAETLSSSVNWGCQEFQASRLSLNHLHHSGLGFASPASRTAECQRFRRQLRQLAESRNTFSERTYR